MYTCRYVYMYICRYVYMYICIYVYMYICIYVYMYIYICICIYHKHTHAYRHKNSYRHRYIHAHVHKYIHARTHLSSGSIKKSSQLPFSHGLHTHHCAVHGTPSCAHPCMTSCRGRLWYAAGHVTASVGCKWHVHCLVEGLTKSTCISCMVWMSLRSCHESF
jgi:hypothetical protein